VPTPAEVPVLWLGGLMCVLAVGMAEVSSCQIAVKQRDLFPRSDSHRYAVGWAYRNAEYD
jgi:hypothetical protein